MQMSRIDFIYYKGGLKVLSSKIVRTAPEIDYVWASDHAGSTDRIRSGIKITGTDVAEKQIFIIL